MQDARREILTQVAAGTLTPVEAASRLDEVERARTEASSAASGSVPVPPIQGVRVRSDYGRVIVIGDASVAEAIAEGPHAARHEDGVLVIESDQSYGGDFQFGRRDGGHWWDGLRGPTVTVRMNPMLELWVNADAGSVNVRDIKAPIHAEVQAGSLVIQRFASPLDLATSAGAIRADGSLKTGASRIRCEIGSVRLALASDSDVRVSAFAEMGRVSLDDGSEPSGRGRGWGGRQEAVFGAGSATLDIESQMGSVTVSRTQ
jgi:hypothetical protein